MEYIIGKKLNHFSTKLKIIRKSKDLNNMCFIFKKKNMCFMCYQL